MSVIIHDVLEANLVLVGIGLLDKPDEKAAFANQSGTEVRATSGVALVESSSPQTPSNIEVLTLERDRVTLELCQPRTTVKMRYPSMESLPRLAEIVDLAIANSNVDEALPRAFGYNFDLIYSPDQPTKASSYVGNRIFACGALASAGLNVVGGMGTIEFESDSNRWKVNLEPRFKDDESTKVYLSLNLHIPEARFPNSTEVTSSLKRIWIKAHNLVQAIDEL